MYDINNAHNKLADDAPTETCANEAGTIIIGNSGYKYCKSNERMNWWNAWAWCDELRKKLFSLDDCGCDGTVNCSGVCYELNGVGSNDVRIWTQTADGTKNASHVILSWGAINHTYGNYRTATYWALCK